MEYKETFTLSILYCDFTQVTYKNKTLEQITYIVDLNRFKNRSIKSMHISKEVN